MSDRLKQFIAGVVEPGEGGDALEGKAFAVLAASAFIGMFSQPSGRALLAVSLVLLVVHLVRARRRFVMTPVGWLALAFAGVAALATAWGVDPEAGYGKMPKLIWFIGIPVGATLVTSARRLRMVLQGLAVGAGVTAGLTLLQRPIQAIHLVQHGKMPDFLSALVSTGSMSDAQRLLLGVLLCMGVIFANRHEGRRTAAWWGLLVLETTTCWRR